MNAPAGRDTAAFEAGTTGSKATGDVLGTAEVHTSLHSGGASGESYSALGFADTTTQDAGLRQRAGAAMHSAADTVREQAGNLGTRATEMASQARGHLTTAMDRANHALEDRGVIAKLQANPLPALGVAFAVGFLLAGGREERTMQSQQTLGTPSGRPRAQRIQSELRTAVLAGLTAGLSQGARSFMNTAGRPDGFLNSFLSNLAGSQQRTEQGTPRMGTAGAQFSSANASTGFSPGTGIGREPSHRENL